MSKRIKWLDFAKGITILSVVMIHSICPPLLGYVLMIFAMPVFFAISGYLYKETNTLKKYINMLYKKVVGLGIPYIIFTIVALILHFISHKSLNIYSNLYHIYQQPIAYLWFLYALFFIFLIIGFMDLIRIPIFIKLILSIIFLFTQMYLPWKIEGGLNINPLAGIGGYMSCFYIGYLIKKYQLIDFIGKCICPLSVLWVIVLIISVHFTGYINYDSDLFNYGDIVIKLLSIPLFFSIFKNFHQDNKIFKYFDRYGKYTLIIYLVHFPVIRIISEISKRLSFNLNDNIIISLFILLLAWSISIYICHLSNRFKIVKWIFYPRKYFDKILLNSKVGHWLFN